MKCMNGIFLLLISSFLFSCSKPPEEPTPTIPEPTATPDVVQIEPANEVAIPQPIVNEPESAIAPPVPVMPLPEPQQENPWPKRTSAHSQDLKSKNYAVLDVFYATDRKRNPNAKIKSLFTADRGELHYGITQISIPRDHRMGELESPSVWKLEFRENPKKHVVMLSVEALEKESYFNALSKKINSSETKSAFVFVHGYNVSFENAARRTAQMSYDLGFDGAPVFYSWPSNGSTAKYTVDEANIQWSQTNIEHFLKDFAEKSDAENIYLIAHSMGNRALTRAYVSVTQKNPSLKSRFKEIILAAPDIDADVFKRDIAPAMVLAGAPITLYASSKDMALIASRVVHGSPRAGDTGDNLVIVAGMETIDSTNVETGLLGHSYYADEESLISDMFYIFKNALRANDRAGLNKRNNQYGDYWEFKK